MKQNWFNLSQIKKKIDEIISKTKVGTNRMYVVLSNTKKKLDMS